MALRLNLTIAFKLGRRNTLIFDDNMHLYVCIRLPALLNAISHLHQPSPPSMQDNVKMCTITSANKKKESNLTHFANEDCCDKYAPNFENIASNL